MLQNGVTELIWHFSGYIHIADELARARAQYEDLEARQDDVELQFTEPDLETNIQDLDQLGSGTSGVDWSDFNGNGLDVSALALRPLPGLTLQAVPDLSPDPGSSKPFFSASFSSSIGISFERSVKRQEGGDETNVDLDQINLLNDNDRLGVREDVTTYELTGINVSYEMGVMWDLAVDAIDESMFPKGGGNITVVGSNLADAQAERANSPDSEPNVELGLHVDGVLQARPEETEEKDKDENDADDDARREGAPPPIPEQPDDWAPGDAGLTAAELGSNTSYNAAVIVDADEGVGTFVVLGDYYKTNSVAQVNIYSDSDNIQIGNGGGNTSLSISLNENEATNSADLSKEALLEEAIDFRGLTGYHWDIDISYGDYFDVKSLYQKNNLSSNDIVSQTTTGAHQRVMVDENGQVNAAFVEDYGKSYDLIVVLGDYFSGNFIQQTNILLDDDTVVMTSSGEGGSQTLYGGQNRLSNEATITEYGLDEFGSVSAGFEAFLLGLETKDEISPEEWWSYSGSGSTKMNVLFVTGDYYDINFIRQINTMADSDVAMQIGGRGSDQFVSTGGNTVKNFATIIDVGAYGDQYVGGEAYEEWTLVQTNIIASEDDRITYGDPDQLASEVIAFAYEHEEEDNHSHTTVTSSSTGDELGHIMA